MRSSLPLLKAHIALFTRPQCGLCVEGKRVLSNAWEQSTRKFDFSEVDITEPANKEWHDKYAFDVPVVHVNGTSPANLEKPGSKLMHRFTVEQVLRALDEAEKNTS